MPRSMAWETNWSSMGLSGLGLEKQIRSVDQDHSTRSGWFSAPSASLPKVPACSRTFRRPQAIPTGGLFCRADTVAETHSVTSDHRSPPVESAWPNNSNPPDDRSSQKAIPNPEPFAVPSATEKTLDLSPCLRILHPEETERRFFLPIPQEEPDTQTIIIILSNRLN